MTKWTIPDDLIARLREMALEKQSEAWGRIDGGQDLSIGAMLAEETANRIEALEAENASLRAAHLTIIQSAPTLQYAIQTSRDALYPKEGGE